MKRIMAMLLCGTMMFSMAACGKETTKEDTEQKETTTASAEELGEANVADFEYNAKDYVTLGDYEKLDVTVNHASGYEPTEEGLEDYVNNTMIAGASNAYYEDESQTEIAEDSVVNVDYTGYLDGEAFQGGAATDVLLDVKNNCTPGGSGYIDGFSSGLVGAKVGDVVDCDVTFPENYGAEQLAGKAVVFRFKVNYICAKADYQSLTDEYVSKVFQYDTVDAFLASAKEAYEANLEQQKKSDLRNAVIQQVIANATVNSYPENVVKARVDDHIRLIMKQFGVSSVAELDAAWANDSSMSGATVAEYRTYVEERVKSNLDSEMVFLAICDEVGLELSDEDLSNYVTEYLGAKDSTDTSLYENYGSTAEIGESYIRRVALANKAVNYCVESANVTISTDSQE